MDNIVEKKQYIVKRSEWLRGGKDGTGKTAEAVLLNREGQKCCLGFIIEQQNFPSISLMGTGEPREACRYTAAAPDTILAISEYSEEEEDDNDIVINEVTDWFNSALADEAMGINDERTINDARREMELRELFKRNDIDLVFVD